MSGLLLRLALLGAVIVVAWLTVRLLERRRVEASRPLPPGILVATSSECRLCALAVATISGLAPGLPLRVVEAADVEGLELRSVPTALVVDPSGAVVLRRSGRSAISDAATVVDTARRLLEGVA